MKLATKKFFHNLLAMAVSVCMVCTLTPSAAWATDSSNGASRSGETVSQDDGTATGESIVRAKVRNTDFSFNGITDPANYDNKDDFEKAITGSNPLKATMPDNGVPDSYTIVWRVQEIEYNDEFDESMGESGDNPRILRKVGKIDKVTGEDGVEQPDPKGDKIFQKTYTKANTPKAKDDNGNDVPTFEYPSRLDPDGMLVQPSDLPMETGKRYEFSIIATNSDGDDVSASTVISLLDDYPPVIIPGNPEGNEAFTVQGGIYQDPSFLPPPPAITVLEVTGIPNTDTAFSTLAEAAMNNTPVKETIEEASQLVLVNSKENDNPLYEGILEVRIPLPASLVSGDGAMKENDPVGVYVVDSDGIPSRKEGKVGWAVDEKGNDLLDDNGERIPVAIIDISGTGNVLGKFAVGIPVGGTYSVVTESDKGGMIDHQGTAARMPLGSLATPISSYAMTPGYLFMGFEMQIDGKSVAINSNDMGFNSVTLNPRNYPAIADGSTVIIKAKYDEMRLDADSVGVSASLKCDPGAMGTLKVSTIDNSTLYDNLNAVVTTNRPLERIEVDAASGILLECMFGNNNTRIKAVKVNEKTIATQGDTFMLMPFGTIDTVADMKIEVEYEQGQPIIPPDEEKETIEVSVSKRPNGTIPAYLIDDAGQKVTTLQLKKNPGGIAEIEAEPLKDEYILKQVLVYSPSNSTTPVDITNHVSASSNTPNASGEYEPDRITLYNITNDMRLDLKYELAPGKFEPGSGSSEGGEWGWVVPKNGITRNASSVSTMSMARAMSSRAASDYTGSIARAGQDLYRGEFDLSAGERARLVIYPRAGYELSGVTINGDPVQSLLTPHTDNAGDVYYALTVYRGEPGSATDQGLWTGDGFSGQQKDQIYYANGASSKTAVYFSPAVIPTPEYVTIFTSVTDFGGGSITPNLRILSANEDVAGAGTATIEFFPDTGYKVDKVWLNDVEVPKRSNLFVSNDYLQLKLTNVTENQRVKVQFTPGDQTGLKDRINVLATAGAGGTITPAGGFQVYDGSSQSFFIVPDTGYVYSSLKVTQGGSELGDDDPALDKSALKITGGLISLKDIKKDTEIEVRFAPQNSSGASSYTINTSKEGEGIVSPTGPLTVGAGADAPFTIIPTQGWYVKEIRVIYTGSPNANGTNLISLYDEGSFTFTLPDVRSDATVKAVFAEGDNGKIPGTEDPDDPDNPDSRKDVPTVPGTKKIDPGNQSILPADKPGAVISPSLGEIEYVPNPDGGAMAPVVLTVTVADGYQLKDPGIVVKDDKTDITNNVTIEEVGDGVYVVTVPKQYVSEKLKVEVTTEPISTSASNATSYDVNLSVIGDGFISPGMLKVGDKNATIKVQEGKGQTFSFIPESGWKLFTVYVDGKPMTLTGNTLTVSNIQKDTTIEAAFSKLGADEPAPQLPKPCQVFVNKTGGAGTVSPQAPTGTEPIKVFPGSNLTINVSPGEKNKAIVTVGGNEVPVIGNTVELTNITAETTTVNVNFVPNVETEYRLLTVNSEGSGTTSPAGTSLVVKGKGQIVTFMPDAGKKLESVMVGTQSKIDDVIDSGTMSLNLGAINDNVTVNVKFCDASALPENDPRQNLPRDDFRYWNVTTSVPKGGGVLSPASAKVGNGGQVVVTAIPANGYELESVRCTREKGGTFTPTVDKGTFTVGITDNTNIIASFKKKNAFDLNEYYSVFVNSSAGGSVSPAGGTTVPAGGSQTITIMPDPNHKVGTIKVGDALVSNFSGSAYTLFNVTKDTNVFVNFVELAKGETGTNVLTHNVTASSTVNGRISPEGVTKVADGKNASFTFVPDTGCKLSYVEVDGTAIPASLVTTNQYIFSDVKENHYIHAVFIKDDDTKYWTVEVGRAANGSVSPADRVVVENGHDVKLTITPFYGYEIENILINENYRLNTSAASFPSSLAATIVDGITCSYDDGVLTLYGVQKDASVDVFFKKGGSVGQGSGEKPNYVPISSGVESNPPNSGSGGSTSIGSGGYMEKPGADASAAERNPNITIVPNPGSMIDKVEITYGDNSRTVIDDDGTYEYDEDGNLIDQWGNPVLDGNGNNVKYPSQTTGPTTPLPNAQKVYQDGFVTIDAEKAGNTGGVSVDVTFRPFNDGEEDTLTKPAYYEINASYSGGGRVYPAGRIKVAQNQNMVFQMLPSAGYELASLNVNDRDAMDQVTSSRKYVFTNINGNNSLSAAFGFINNDMVKPHTVTAHSNSSEGAGVSPERVNVPTGADAVVYFLPPANHKVARVEVTKTKKDENGADKTETLLNSTSYTGTMYAASNIDGDIHVEVTYEPAGENEYSWTVDTVDVSAKSANNDKCKVSPEGTIKVPVASPQTFYFEPAAGYIVDYVMFNGIATALKNNPSSFTVMPSQGEDNELLVYFREATSKDRQYTTVTPEILREADNKVYASVEPASLSVEVGSSVDFYVSPTAGHTIKSVKVNGWPVTPKPAIAANEKEDTNAVYSTYIVTLDDVQAGTKVEIETDKTDKRLIEISKHKLTVTGINTMYTPMGSMQLPEGGKQTITINPLSGYFLDSVTVTETDGFGNTTTKDITDSVSNNEFTVEMGKNDMLVEIKYLEVGSTKTTPAYITLGKAETDKGAKVKASISMQKQGEELVNVLTVDEEGRLADSTGKAIEFVRGSSYTFYTTAEPLDGKELILSSATFNGAEQSVPNLTGMIANLKVTSNGTLDLVFRELKEGEEPIVTRTFDVRFDIVKGSGRIDPLEVLSIPQGNSTGEIKLTPGTSDDDDQWMIESVYAYTLINGEKATDEDGNVIPGIQVPARLYKNETYEFKPMTDTLVEVSFVQCALVDVQWDKTLGFVAPNPATEYLKLPVEDVQSGKEFQFIVAPYEDCYVNGFDVISEDSEPKSYLQDLRQSNAVAQYIADGGYNVINVHPDQGVESPDGSTEEQSAGGVTTFALEARAGDLDIDPMDNFGFVPAQGTNMQNVYGVQAALGANKSTVRVGLYQPDRTVYYTITPSVKASADGKIHGTISPNTPQRISDAAMPFTFTFTPENSNYVVTSILINGSPVENAVGRTSYTFERGSVVRDTSIQVEFGTRTSANSTRLLRVATRLAQTGDLTGPVVGALLLVAAAGLATTAVSYIRRQQRRRRRMQGMQ